MKLLLAEVPAPVRPNPRANPSAHLIDRRTDHQRPRCAWCGNNTPYVCLTCNVPLHPTKCFLAHHTQPITPIPEDDEDDEEDQDEEEEEEEDDEESVEEEEDEEVEESGETDMDE